MPLSKTQLSFLKKLAHDIEPVVRVGQNGLSKNVMNEISTSLEHHELMKIKIRVGDRSLRDQITEDVIQNYDADLVQKIGNIVTIYKQSKKKKIKLPSK